MPEPIQGLMLRIPGRVVRKTLADGPEPYAACSAFVVPQLEYLIELGDWLQVTNAVRLKALEDRRRERRSPAQENLDLLDDSGKRSWSTSVLNGLFEAQPVLRAPDAELIEALTETWTSFCVAHPNEDPQYLAGVMYGMARRWMQAFMSPEELSELDKCTDSLWQARREAKRGHA